MVFPHVIGLRSIDHLNMKNMNLGFGVISPGFINLLGNSGSCQSRRQYNDCNSQQYSKHLNQDSGLQQPRSKSMFPSLHGCSCLITVHVHSSCHQFPASMFNQCFQAPRLSSVPCLVLTTSLHGEPERNYYSFAMRK
jgi:hypothetical protein